MGLGDRQLSENRRVETIAPCNLEQAKKVCRGFGVKSDLRQTRFLVFQDKPAESASKTAYSNASTGGRMNVSSE